MNAKIEPMKTLSVGDPVAINKDGFMIRWTEDCGCDLKGYLPEGCYMIDKYMVIPPWFSKQLFGGNCE